MSRDGRLEVPTPLLAVEGWIRVVELVGASWVGLFIAAATMIYGVATVIVRAAGAPAVGGCFVVGAGGELVWGGVAGRRVGAVDASSFGGRWTKIVAVGTVHCRTWLEFFRYLDLVDSFKLLRSGKGLAMLSHSFMHEIW